MLPPGIKIQGVKGFTFEDVSRATNNFNPDNELGQGGYGKVYKGVLPDGIPVAIKRAEEGSMQNAVQFYTEIELLSRVHHRNLVSLLGYCNDRGEQMLVYEFMAGGTLRDHLTRKLHLHVFEANFDILFIKFYLLCSVEVPMLRMYVCASHYSDGDYGLRKATTYSAGDCTRHPVSAYGSRPTHISPGHQSQQHSS